MYLYQSSDVTCFCIIEAGTQRQDESGEGISNSKHGNDIRPTSTSAGHQAPVASDCQQEPLYAFRHGYLWVSDFSSQAWCEQKLLYSYTAPALVQETPAMAQGATLHLARGKITFQLKSP